MVPHSHCACSRHEKWYLEKTLKTATLKGRYRGLSSTFRFFLLDFGTNCFKHRNVSICRLEVLYGSLERSDAEVLFIGARKHVCLMCIHVAHQAHKRFPAKSQFLKT